MIRPTKHADYSPTCHLRNQGGGRCDKVTAARGNEIPWSAASPSTNTDTQTDLALVFICHALRQGIELRLGHLADIHLAFDKEFYFSGNGFPDAWYDLAAQCNFDLAHTMYDVIAANSSLFIPLYFLFSRSYSKELRVFECTSGSFKIISNPDFLKISIYS